MREFGAADLQVSEVSQAQMERMEQLQESLDPFYGTICENGAKVGATATISSDLNFVSTQINKPLAPITFKMQTIAPQAGGEKRRYPSVRNCLLTSVYCDGGFRRTLA